MFGEGPLDSMSQNIQLSMADPNGKSHKGNLGYAQVSFVVDICKKNIIYLKTKTIEHWHIIIKKYLNLNGFIICHYIKSVLMSFDLSAKK